MYLQSEDVVDLPSSQTQDIINQRDVYSYNNLLLKSKQFKNIRDQHTIHRHMYNAKMSLNDSVRRSDNRSQVFLAAETILK